MIFSTKERQYKFFITYTGPQNLSISLQNGLYGTTKKTIESFLEVLRLEKHFFIELKCSKCLLKISKHARNILYFRIHVHIFNMFNILYFKIHW